MSETKFYNMRAYTLQATTLKNDSFPRFLKTGNWVLVFAQVLKKLERFFLARMRQNFPGIFPNDPPSKFKKYKKPET